MEYYLVSLNGAPLARACDTELEQIKEKFDFVLITSDEGVIPVVGIDFYSDYKGTTLFVIEIYEEVEQ